MCAWLLLLVTDGKPHRLLNACAAALLVKHTQQCPILFCRPQTSSHHHPGSLQTPAAGYILVIRPTHLWPCLNGPAQQGGPCQQEGAPRPTHNSTHKARPACTHTHATKRTAAAVRPKSGTRCAALGCVPACLCCTVCAHSVWVPMAPCPLAAVCGCIAAPSDPQSVLSCVCEPYCE